MVDFRPGYIRTRWGLVDLSVVLMKLREEVREVAPEQIMDFFQDFEEERRTVGVKLGDLQTKLVELSVDGDPPPDAVQLELPEISSQMLSYYLAFAREGASEENVATRTTIMYQSLLEFLG